jgi:hypothetical protein
MRVACVLLLIVMASCAPGAQGTPLPPMTFAPPPTITFTGDCTINRDLSNWLEFSTFYVSEFMKLVSEAAAKSAADAYSDVIMMGRMRRDFSGIAAPDCAETAQQMIVSAMTRAVDGFQSFVNRGADSLGNTVAEVLSQFDQVIVLQNDLTARLEAQLGSP